MISTSVAYGSQNFRIGHRKITEPPPGVVRNDVITVADPQNEADMETEISFSANGRQKTVLYYWNAASGAETLGILYAAPTGRLFVGGGGMSFVCHLPSLRVVTEQINSCMFWRFEQISDRIIEFGELDCFLYNLEGRLLDRCSVDPPYEYEVTPQSINFHSPVMGAGKLEFQHRT